MNIYILLARRRLPTARDSKIAEALNPVKHDDGGIEFPSDIHRFICLSRSGGS
jgi:hypothetical protein